ncbi:MAG: DUF1440 domain-containing protein [Symbiopectobacterium sp.]|uniref:DUF1440 domain-containing protein n=1 Tax=Symbiopectobacterium sp. TaxID=2952789 RepID=UPI003F3AEFFE
MQLRTTRDKILVALLVGIIAGVVCTLAKFGWEIPFPPRTPLRDLTNSPQQMGMSFDMSHLSYLYNSNPRPIMSFIMQFGFSITFAVIYCVVAEVWPKIKLWQDALYGLVLHVVFHVFLLPLMGTVPAP